MSIDVNMKRQFSRVTGSSTTDRRSGLLTRRVVKNALSTVRGFYGKFRREVVRRTDAEPSRTATITMEKRMRLDEEELRNLRNENLENELKELAMRREMKMV